MRHSSLLFMANNKRANSKKKKRRKKRDVLHFGILVVVIGFGLVCSAELAIRKRLLPAHGVIASVDEARQTLIVRNERGGTQLLLHWDADTETRDSTESLGVNSFQAGAHVDIFYRMSLLSSSYAVKVTFLKAEQSADKARGSA